MRKVFVGLLLLVGVAVTANFALAMEDIGGTDVQPRLTNAKPGLETRAAKLRSSLVVGDTTYVGFTPGRFSSTKNWWSIGAGFSPGNSNSPAFRRPYAGQGGMWDFETFVNGDSMQGWWSDRQLMNGTGGLIRPDWNRPWWALEIGNKASFDQPGASRTYGVVGVWHRDDFSAPSDGGANGPNITPIGGSFSAWMGLRRDGDNKFVDPITGNPFNSRVMQFTVYNAASVSGSDNGFPGYGSQMDQMLYRDIDMTGNTGRDLTIGYQYRLRMSTGFGNAPATRTGWFDKDPLQVTGGGVANNAPGNFISATDAGDAGTPRDSFTVYIGAPVGSSFLASTGVTLPVYDSQRRWFDEVIRSNEAGLWKQVDGDTGSVPLATKTVTIPNSTLAPMLAASGGKVRLVFRVHTNRGFDDQGTAFTSGRAGAAVLDNVTYQMVGGPASPAGWGTFEAVNSIDNNTAVDPANAWKSTGKPPQPYTHAHSIATLQYDDLCGQPGDASRVCNLDGVVLSLGDHDNSEAASGLVDGSANRELWIGAVSPTIQLRSDNGAWPNPIGLANPALGGAQDGNATEDYWIDYDIYMGVFDPFSKGVLWRFGFMSYPAVDRNGSATWGNLRTPPYIIFNPDQQCVRDIADNPIAQNAMLRWTGSLSENSDFPDSVRIMVGHRSECYRFGVSTGCAPTDGSYFDNLSLAIVDGAPAPISASIWDLYNDTFPANETAGLPGFLARFDTTAALIKSGLNVSQTTGNVQRWDVPGDSVAVTAFGTSTRVDMIFRILPGPGNYVTIGRPDLGTLRRVPTSVTPVAGAVLNSSNFWESYLANNGAKGTPGGHSGGVWNANVWNSARCDTSEGGVFAVQARGILGGPGDDALFDTQYHESELGIAPNPAHADPYPVITYRSAQGLSRHRCYLASASAATTNIDCVHDAPTIGAGYDLSYLSTPGSGWDGTNTTVEKTKILPDGLLTPGAHVQYFFRKETDGGTFAGFMPETNTVFTQIEEGSFDAHRWQQFSVLPDRWKDPNYRNPVLGSFGAGNACMLVVDNNDRRGDERVWVSVADTIGSTIPAKHGAHNGWFAPGTGTPAVNDPTNFVRRHGGSPGSTWDFYQVKASESLNSNAGSLGSRLSFRDPANTQINGKTARLGPTPEMLSTFYQIIMLFSGDLNSGILGPFLNKSQNDVQIIEDWLAEGNTSAIDVNRGFWASGNGFIESSFFEGGDQDLFISDFLGVTLRNNSYTLESTNTELTVDLTPSAGSALAPLNDIWGVQNVCLFTNDVLERTPSLLAQTNDNAKYENAGPGPFPILASVAKVHSAAQPWISVVDGFDIINLRSRFDTDAKGRHRYFNEVASLIFAGICPIGGTALISLDVPGVQDGSQFVDFMNLRGNPSYGRSTIEFGLAKADRVELRIFDVGGRLVRTLADRNFEAGKHSLVWDGSDNSGKQVARGVYFTQLRFVNRNVTNAKKLTVLK